MTAPETTAPPTAPPPSTGGEQTLPLAFVTEMLRSLTRATKAHQLYSQNNPMHVRATEGLRASLEALWRKTESLVLEIGEREFRCFGQVVFEDPEKTSESLAWTFYKDGIRELKIKRGFEQRDMNIVLDLLQFVRGASSEADDLLTLFWEQEFTHLEYAYVEAGAGDFPYDPIEGGAKPEQFEPPAQMADATGDRVVSAPAQSGTVRMEDFDPTLYFLDEAETERLRAEINKEFTGDIRPSVIAALLDTFEQRTEPQVREEIAVILENLLLALLATSQVRAVAYLLRETGVTAGRARELTDAQRQRLTGMPERLSNPEVLSQILETLETADLTQSQPDLIDLFLLLGSKALETILTFHNRTTNAQLRTLLETAADRLAAAHTAELVRIIGSSDAAVALEAIRRSASMKSAAAVQPLALVLNDGVEPGMRLAAVNALTEIGSPGALQVLEKTVEDRDRDVRIAGTRALATRGYRAALPRVERVIRGKPLRETKLSEKLAFFEAFATLAGESGFELLDQILHGQGPMGKREDPEVRACAASALAKISSPRARESLERAANDKEPVVKSAVARALRGVAA
jgi:HEAT repeat protein